MSRFTFGGTSGDSVTQPPQASNPVARFVLNANATGTFWSTQTGNTQYTDLLDAATGVAITGLSTDQFGRLRQFRGPDGVMSGWVDFGAGRFFVAAYDGVFTTGDNNIAGFIGSAGSATQTAGDGRWARSIRKLIAGTGLTGGGDLTADRTLAVAYGTAAGTAAQGNDPRLNAQTVVSAYSSPQAAIDAAPAGGIVFFDVNATITAPLNITKALTLLGKGLLNTTLTANGCDAIHLASGQTQVNVKQMQIQASTPYTTTTNSLIGILVAGSDTASPGYDLFSDLYIQGFQTAIQTNSLQSSRFERIYCQNGLYGIDVYGLSENNLVHGCQLTVGTGTSTRLSGSVVVRLNGQKSPTDTTADHSEGWTISDSVLFGGDYGVNAQGYGSYQIHGCVLDYNHVSGIWITNDGTAAGGAASIVGNYIAMASDASATAGAIDLNSTVTDPRGSRIIGNEIVAYGSTAPYGVRCIGNSADSRTIIMGNTFAGFSTNDIKLSCSGNIVIGNFCQTNLTYNIYTDAGQFNLIEGNLWGSGPAKVFVDSSGGFPNNYNADSGGHFVMRGTAAPTALSWTVGDRVVNSAPAVGSPKAWVCTVAGSPGTWVSEGNL